ncbi:MAG: MmgE/PrpD family protein [Burkholderiaceae bacterium]
MDIGFRAEGLTNRIAEAASRGMAGTPGPHVRHAVSRAFTDTVAVMLAGRSTDAVRAVRRHYLASTSGPSEASVLLGPEKTASRIAALINATAAHVLDFDDVALQSHPSAVLVPALLAEGERLHVRGTELVNAYVVGYGVWAELISRDADPHHMSGWHPTSVFGSVASAAAVCALRRASAVETRHALGIAASLSGGVMANFGSMTKPLHAGLAAAHGIEASELAACGLTSAEDALEHRSGLLAVVSPRGKVDLSAGELRRLHGATEAIELSVKQYPVCNAVHRVLDAALALIAAHDIAPGDVEVMRVTVSTVQRGLLRYDRPQNALEAKFSLPFALACVLHRRRLGLAELCDEFVRSADIHALIPRIQIEGSDARSPTHAGLPLNELELVLKDGRAFADRDIGPARGSPTRPLGIDELRSKFDDCLSTVERPARDLIWTTLMDLDAVADVSTMMPTLSEPIR